MSTSFYHHNIDGEKSRRCCISSRWW